jgi:hypothetical protein
MIRSTASAAPLHGARSRAQFAARARGGYAERKPCALQSLVRVCSMI